MSAPTSYKNILYEKKDGVATFILNRLTKYDAFRGKTCNERLYALGRAGWSKAIGMIVLTGAGSKGCALSTRSASRIFSATPNRKMLEPRARSFIPAM